MIEVAKITIILLKTKNALVVRSIAIKEEEKKYYVLIKNRHIKNEKYITPMDFAEQKILQNQTFQRISSLFWSVPSKWTS